METIDGVTVRWAYSVPGEIWRVCWEIETIWVRSGFMTEPSNGEVYDGTASPTSTTFSFKISSIRTAPTTEPQGSFTLTILNSRSKSIDSSQNNKIGGLDPK